MTLSRQNDPFAVSTPMPHAGGANLSPQERQIYEFMWQHRDQIPTLGSLVGRNFSRWLIVGGSVALFIVLLYALDATLDATFAGRDDPDWKPYLVPAAIGLWLGVVLRDYGQCKMARRLWLIEASVIDWPKVERLLWGEGQSNDLPQAKRPTDDAPLAAIPVDEGPSHVEDPAR